MHPNVRITTFLVFAGFLAAGGAVRVWLAALALAMVYGFAGAPALEGLWRALARLRYLWLSLAVLYLWFTPGQALWPELGAWSPTLQGVAQAAVRIAVLVLMVAAAQLLLRTTSTAQLVAALVWLTGPLRWLGLDRHRFALRLVLVLETVPELRRQPPQVTSPGVTSGGRFARHLELLRNRWRLALDGAAAAPARTVELPDTAAVPHWQWLYPLALAVLLAAAGRI